MFSVEGALGTLEAPEGGERQLLHATNYQQVSFASHPILTGSAF